MLAISQMNHPLGKNHNTSICSITENNGSNIPSIFCKKKKHFFLNVNYKYIYEHKPISIHEISFHLISSIVYRSYS